MIFPFPLEIKKSLRLKHLKLKIDSEKRCAVLVTPPVYNQKAADNFVNRYAEWVIKKLSAVKDRIYYTKESTVMILGHEYKIEFHDDAYRYSRKSGNLITVFGKEEDIHKEIIKNARKELEKYVWQRVPLLAKEIGVTVNDITVKKMKSRYGSCSSLHNLNFNLILAFAPLFVTDMVIAHEVMHLKYMNHGKDFKSELVQICPSCCSADLWLKKNAADLWRISL